jgi:molecular chaperone DnaK
LIERNTTIPTKKSEIFSTASENQPSVEIHVLQGERKMSRDNKPIGKFNLDSIPPAPRGVPQIEVEFDLDANGILKVSAKDLGTGKEQKITIQASSGLSDSEVEQMVKDAEKHAGEDEAARAAVDTRNSAENLVYQTEKMLVEFGDKVPEDKKAPVQSAIDDLKKSIETDDTEQMQAKIDALNTAMQAVSSEMYANAAPEGGAPEPGADAADAGGAPESEEAKNEDVIDADFEMVDEDKKA